MSMVIGHEPDAGYIAELIEKSRIYPKYTTPVAMALEYKCFYSIVAVVDVYMGAGHTRLVPCTAVINCVVWSEDCK